MSDIKFVDRQESINPITQFGEYLYNRLPKVYRDYDVEIERLNVETQKKETFKTLKEYLYSFALGGFQPLLEDLEAIISLVDPFKCPSEFLPYLLRHFGLDYIDDIPEKFQRRLVQNVVTLYKKKGTIPAVAFLAKELSGFDVKIEEKSDGSIEFALIKLNAYEDEDAELLLAQDVIQRYIHLFLPAQTKSKIIVVYGFTENIHINPNGKSEDTTYDHAYYDVDEYEDITYIDENGYDSKTGGYSEAFDYLKHVVEDDFNALKLKLEEESHNFSPSLPDLTSLTNCVENEGLPTFTNGISCEDTITEQKLTSTTGEVEFNIPASASNISVNKLVGGGDYAVLPIYKCTTDLLKGTTLEFKYDGKSYGYYTLERDLYASDVFPTTFQLDIYNNMVRVYNHYFTEIIDESYDFTLYSGYGSYYTHLRNGSIPWTWALKYIRIKCDYDKEFKKTNNIYEQPTDTPTIVFGSPNTVYLSLLDVITSPESTKEFVKTYPITIIAPSDNGSYSYSTPCGKTIAYKKLSNTPVSGSTTIECTIYTMNDRKTVFAYESPVFTQNSNIAISGYYGLKTFPESHIIGDYIQVTGHLTGVSLIDYKVYGNCVQNGTPSPDTPIEIQSVGDLVTDTSSEYYGKYDVPVTVRGKNLIPTPTFSTFTKNGVKFTNNKDGSITINGTPTAYTATPNMSLPESTLEILRNNVCVLTGFYYYEKNISLVLAVGLNGNWVKYIYLNPYTYKNYVKVDLTNVKFDTVVFAVRSQKDGVLIDNLTIKPFLEVGTTMPTSFEPYVAPVTKNIYLDEPLRKLGDYADYIDYENQKVVRNVNMCGIEQAKGLITSYTNLNALQIAKKEDDIGYMNQSISLSMLSNLVEYIVKPAGFDDSRLINKIYVAGTGVYFIGLPKSITTKEGAVDYLAGFKLYYRLSTPIEEPIEVPDLITTNSNTMYMYLGTSTQPSSIDITYYENTPVPQLSEIVYDLGIPLVSFDGYSESIEKIDGKYYLRSAIKEIPLEYMYDNLVSGSYADLEFSCVDWFSLRGNSFSESTPYYFNMSPCKSNVDQVPVREYVGEGDFARLPNYWDTFDFLSIFNNAESSNPYGDDCVTIAVNGEFEFWSGECLDFAGLESFKRVFNYMFRYSDIPPKFYIYDKYNKYGGETLTEITDKEVINKLNLLPIPEDYAIISSKGIKYSSMDVSVQSKRYY